MPAYCVDLLVTYSTPISCAKDTKAGSGITTSQGSRESSPACNNKFIIFDKESLLTFEYATIASLSRGKFCDRRA